MRKSNAVPKEVATHLQISTQKGRAAKLEKTLRGPKAHFESDDPIEALRRLVREHKSLVKKATAAKNMASDRKVKKAAGSRHVGDVIKCELPEDVQQMWLGVVEVMDKKASALKSDMLRELKRIPVYKIYLSKVFGLGEIVSAYLISELDPRDSTDPSTGLVIKARKPSSFKQFCGMAVHNGRLSRRTAKEKNNFSGEMRTRLFQGAVAMWKNRAKYTVCEKHTHQRPAGKDSKEDKAAFRKLTLGCAACRKTETPFGKTSKYLKVWTDYKHRMEHSERRQFDAKKGYYLIERIGCENPDMVSANGFIHSTGWHKAVDVLLEDLYMVWRAIEGLPVWPSYYAAYLGYEHGGKIAVNAPKAITVDEALTMIGEVGGYPLDTFEGDDGAADEEDEVEG